MCACCDRRVPPGAVWCSWACRGLDDRHDDLDYLAEGDDA